MNRAKTEQLDHTGQVPSEIQDDLNTNPRGDYPKRNAPIGVKSLS